MNIRKVLPAALIAAGFLALPAAAVAAEGVVLSAQSGAVVEVHAGETVSAVLGVADTGDQAAEGVVVNIRAVNDFKLPTTFSNCLYYIDSNVEGAWCQFDGTLEPGKVYQIDGFKVSAASELHADKTSSVIAVWQTVEATEKQGGLKALAAGSAGQGNPVKVGTEGAAALVASDVTLKPENSHVGTAHLKLIYPAASPSASVTATATASASAPAPAGDTPTASASSDDGGLPVTGSNSSALAGIGVGVVLVGGLAFLLARRRRTSFEA